MKFVSIIPQLNLYQLTEWDFWSDVTVSSWRPWCHFTQKTAVIWPEALPDRQYTC